MLWGRFATETDRPRTLETPRPAGKGGPRTSGQAGEAVRVTTTASPDSGPLRKSYFLPRGCLCPRLALVGLGIAEEKPALSAWFSRVYREYEAGNLTPLWRDVLRALGRFDACRFGIFPSHQFLARRARCSVRTVQRALQAARRLGLVDWCHQRVRAAWRLLRASNRYVLRTPTGPVQPGPHGPAATTGQAGRGVTQPREKPASERSGGTWERCWKPPAGCRTC